MIGNERKWEDMKGCERKMKDLKKTKEMQGNERNGRT